MPVVCYLLYVGARRGARECVMGSVFWNVSAAVCCLMVVLCTCLSKNEDLKFHDLGVFVEGVSCECSVKRFVWDGCGGSVWVIIVTYPLNFVIFCLSKFSVVLDVNVAVI